MRTSPEQSRAGTQRPPVRWRFGAFELDRTTRELLHGGKRVHLAKRPFDVLEYLIAERPRLVGRGELLQQFWSGREVYEEALTRCVSSIRKALDDRDNPPLFLETRWNVGYRFIGKVTAAIDQGPAAAVDEEGAVVATPTGAEPSPAVTAPSRRRARWLAAAAVVLLAAGGWWLGHRSAQPGSTQQIRSVAILPLEVSGLDAQLVEGVNDELLQAVSRIEGLRVIARGSVLRTIEDTRDAVAIGRALGVQALLTGRVRQATDHTVVAIRLVDARDAAVLWSYDARFDPLAMADSPHEVATRLATHLSARLRTAPAHGSLRPDDYARYLRARHYWNQRTGASLREAIRLYEQVIAAEPDYADAHAGLAEAWLLMPLYAGAPPFEAHPKARAAAEAALRINPEASRAHMVLGVVSSQFEWDWRSADEHFLRAIALDPNNATAYQWRAESFCYRGQFERCEADLREALALDPLSPVLATAQGLPARFAGEWARARELFTDALRKHPSFALAEFELALIDSAEGRWHDAIARYERVLPAMGPILGGAPLGYAYARAGRTDDAQRILDDLRRLGTTQYVPPIAFSDVAIGLGDRELSLAWLGRAVAVHDDFITQVGVDHHHRDLHGDPRFQAIMARVGTPLQAGTGRLAR